MEFSVSEKAFLRALVLEERDSLLKNIALNEEVIKDCSSDKRRELFQEAISFSTEQLQIVDSLLAKFN